MTEQDLANALAELRRGAHYSISGRTLVLNGIAVAITGDEFDVIWDVLDEVEGDDFDLSLTAADSDSSTVGSAAKPGNKSESRGVG